MTFHEMMAAFYADREQYLSTMERECLGYATEESEYRALNPMPQLRDYMILRSQLMGA
jgi:hypothetical protein